MFFMNNLANLLFWTALLLSRKYQELATIKMFSKIFFNQAYFSDTLSCSLSCMQRCFTFCLSPRVKTREKMVLQKKKRKEKIQVKKWSMSSMDHSKFLEIQTWTWWKKCDNYLWVIFDHSWSNLHFLGETVTVLRKLLEPEIKPRFKF